MTGNVYRRLAQVTANKELTQEQHLMNGVMGLNGEAGEVVDIVKKHLFQGHALDKDKIIDELSDVMWYVAETASAIGVKLDDIMEHNIQKLAKRYPDGFSAEKSVYRNE